MSKSTKRQRTEQEQISDDMADTPPAISSDWCAKNGADEVDARGFTMLPFIDARQLQQIRREFDNTSAQFPEYKQNTKGRVMGGFCAYGNPSSFHNIFVRQMRLYAHSAIIDLMSFIIAMKSQPSKWKLQQIVDRMALRPAGTKATKESWHRDEAKLANDTDTIYGGWVNLDSEDQEFSCVPGTHTEVRGHAGFAPIRDKEEKERYKTKSLRVRIPPGYMIVFNETIVHEVVSKAFKHGMYRLFLGWRITTSDQPLFPIRDLLKDQAVMPLKSGQIPPIYAALHWTNHVDKIVRFTEENIKPQCTETKTMMSGKRKGESFNVVNRHMKSTRESRLRMYPPYADYEIAILEPGHSWIIGGISMTLGNSTAP